MCKHSKPVPLLVHYRIIMIFNYLWISYYKCILFVFQVFSDASMMDDTAELSKFLRFGIFLQQTIMHLHQHWHGYNIFSLCYISFGFRFFPDYLEDLEEHVCDFFKSLPNIPIICISLLGGDYANLIGEMLFLPSFFPAWILVSRLVANNQPVVMLLPVNLIEEGNNFQMKLLTLTVLLFIFLNVESFHQTNLKLAFHAKSSVVLTQNLPNNGVAHGITLL